ncbi:MAG: hypothetical protein K2O49_09475 [Muribaculaceae bacterium]|nr:hypothetical protein [Muribaculaceae bacterium]
MKKLFLFLSVVATCGLMLPSCSDEVPAPESTSTRSYEKDAEILSQFVDVDKSKGEYFINESLKVNPSDYVINSSVEELYKVNPANRQRFQKELTELNRQLDLMAKRADVEQIVYMTGNGNVWIRNINENPEITLEAVQNPLSRSVQSLYWTMELTPNIVQEANFTAPARLTCDININMFGSKYYFFEVGCYTNNASKSPNGDYPAGGGSNSKAIIISGTGSMEYYQFIWTVANQAGNVNWSFKGRLYNPTTIGNYQITAKFMD